MASFSISMVLLYQSRRWVKQIVRLLKFSRLATRKYILSQTFSQILILSKSLLQTPFSLDWPENVLEEMNIDSDEEQLEII